MLKQMNLHNLMEWQKGQTKPNVIMEFNINNWTAYLIYEAPVIHA